MARPAPAALHPIPRLHARVWGGQRLVQAFGGEATTPVGEAWLLCDDSELGDVTWSGRTVREALATLGRDFVGAVPADRYGLVAPVLVKLLDTADWLSIQVHPDDDFAAAHEQTRGGRGKDEAWYVLDAGPGAEVVHGFRQQRGHAAIDPAAIRAAAQRGALRDLLHREPVTAGLLVPVPAGTVHALGPRLLVYEVQQPCDITYRLDDYDRGRELELERGLSVAHLGRSCRRRTEPWCEPGHPQTAVLVACPNFVLRRHSCSRTTTVQAPGESCALFTCIAGTEQGASLLVGAGRPVMLPAGIWLEAFLPSAERLTTYPASLHLAEPADNQPAESCV